MQGFIHNQKGSGVIGDIIEKYVAANETIEAGSFVEFVNGLSEGSILTTSPINLECNTSAGAYFEAELLTENKVIIAYYDYYNTTTRYLTTRILTINKNQIIIGPEYTLNNVETSDIRIKALNPNAAIIIYERYNPTEDYRNHGYAIGVKISDEGVITPSNIINYTTTTSSNGTSPAGFCKVSSNSAFVAYENVTNHYLKAVVLSYNIETNSISAGPTSTLASVYTTDVYATNLIENQIALVYRDTDSETIMGKKISISGTTITTDFTNTLLVNDIGISSGVQAYSILALASDKILVKSSYYENGSNFRYTVFKIYNNNFNPGNNLQSEYFSGNYLNTLVKTDENTVITYGDEEYEVLDIKDTYISLASSGKLPDDTKYDGTQLLKVADGRMLLITDTSPNFIGRVLVIDDNKLTTEIIEGTFEVQARKATTSKVDGVARTTGTGGSREKHGETIQVYVPKIEQTTEGEEE